MIDIKFYLKDNCPLCDEALLILDVLKDEYPYTIEYRDIYTNDRWLEQYHLLIPVIESNNKQIHAGQITYDKIKHFLTEANEN